MNKMSSCYCIFISAGVNAAESVDTHQQADMAQK